MLKPPARAANVTGQADATGQVRLSDMPEAVVRYPNVQSRAEHEACGAGMLALTDMSKRLHEDQRNAKLLAEGECPFKVALYTPICSNGMQDAHANTLIISGASASLRKRR